ncbi:MAG: thiolase family protein [Dehalococcoidia bacterium]|uniref:thiolase family protein n=1 Tax=Candidatus Amarobacter glycogenicus TaxID=3140699 RepID=UPI003135AAC7|nr:thiolase family protein [Dehalococcoidia bacterium]
MQLQNAVIVDGARSAFGRGGRGKLVATRLDEVGAQVVRALLERNPKVDPALIEDIAMGNVGGAGELAGIGADTIARLAGLPAEISAVDSNRQCGSSMETLHRVAQSIMVGATEAGIAIGAERMGRSLGGGPRGTATRITEFNQKRLKQTDVQRNMAANHFQDFSVPFPDEILDYSPVLSMTQTAQNAAEVYGLSREDMDQFSVDSHKKAVAAYEKGIYKDEIIPLEVEEPVFDAEGNWVEAERGKTIIFDRDECIRPGTNMETLGSLPAIKGVVSPTGQEIRITAGNSCPTNDGFTAAIIMSEKKALELGLTPLARIVGFGIAGVKPQVMGLGPIPSTRKALRHAGITADQIDRVEFNEAFAAQVIPSCKELGIPLDRVNVNGGSIALGHPLGATGARLVLAVAHELRRSGGRYGLATQCIGAGMGISTIIERM